MNSSLGQQPTEPSFYATQNRHLRQCLKEAWIAVACWLVGLVYCTVALVALGYVPPAQRPAEPQLVWGLPAWVFWGLFFPWFAQIASAWWFALRVLKDDEPYMEFPDRQENQGTDDR